MFAFFVTNKPTMPGLFLFVIYYIINDYYWLLLSDITDNEPATYKTNQMSLAK